MDRLRSFSSSGGCELAVSSSSSCASTSSVLRGMTVDLERTFLSCALRQESEILTKLTQPLRNGGFDNADGDFILKKHATIVNPEGRLYDIRAKLGQGTFGQVVRCGWTDPPSSSSSSSSVPRGWPTTTGGGGGVGEVALKVIKNRPTYFNQALIELRVLQRLNERYSDHIVKMVDYFVYRKHLCIVFELLHTNLYELIKSRNYTGLGIGLVVQITQQLLQGLVYLRQEQILHSDLKPENLMLTRDGHLKLIDLGSAAFVGATPYTYIQSRFYRAPDVILGIQPFTTAIDMWSFGCVLGELAVGVPFFPGTNEHDQLCRIVESLGPVPPSVISRGRHLAKFYRPSPSSDSYVLVSSTEYRALAGKPLLKDSSSPPSTRYPSEGGILGLLRTLRARLYDDDLLAFSQSEEDNFLLLVADLMTRCFIYDPSFRLSPNQALSHPLYSPYNSKTSSFSPSSLAEWVPPPLQSSEAENAGPSSANLQQPQPQQPASLSSCSRLPPSSVHNNYNFHIKHHVGSAPVTTTYSSSHQHMHSAALKPTPAAAAPPAPASGGGGGGVTMTPDASNGLRLGQSSLHPDLLANLSYRPVLSLSAAVSQQGGPAAVSGGESRTGVTPGGLPGTPQTTCGESRGDAPIQRRGRSNSESEILVFRDSGQAGQMASVQMSPNRGGVQMSIRGGVQTPLRGHPVQNSSSAGRGRANSSASCSLTAVQQQQQTTPQMLQESLWRQASISRQALHHQQQQQQQQQQQRPPGAVAAAAAGGVQGGASSRRSPMVSKTPTSAVVAQAATYRS